jgi:hypothetical protein
MFSSYSLNALILLLLSQTAQALDVCTPMVSLASDSVGNIMDLPEVKDLPLPESFKAALEAHPLTQALRHDFESGKNLSIDLGRPGLAFKGETLQTRFLAKIISIVLPKAHIVDRHSSPNPKLKPFYLTVSDTAERGDRDIERSSNVIEMSILKPVNPGGETLDKNLVREIIGLHLDDKIASFYSSTNGDHEDYLPVLKEMFKTGIATGIIFSHTRRRELDIVEEFAKSEKIKCLRISELKRNSISKGEKFILLNDTIGRLPYIHTASDFVFVFGQGNIFESLNVNRHTYFFRYPRNGYSYSAWDRMTFIAEATNGGHAIDDLGHLHSVIQSTVSLPFGRPIYLVTDREGTSALTRLLRNITRAMSPAGQFRMP